MKPLQGESVAMEIRATHVVTIAETGERLFAKRWCVRDPWASRRVRALYQAERTALRMLAGLAVPALRRLAPSLLAPQWRRGYSHVVTETYEGEKYHNHARPSFEGSTSVGVWLFCLEQFVAFRRRKILYTDVKCSNVVCKATEPLSIVLVDFDRIIPLVGRRQWERFGVTRGFEPPEYSLGRPVSEASCVYQCGMLLLHLMTNGHNGVRDKHIQRGGRLSAALRSAGAGALGPIVRQALRADPKRRPPNYEELWRRVSKVRLSDEVERVWVGLRTPYSVALAQLGLRRSTWQQRLPQA